MVKTIDDTFEIGRWIGGDIAMAKSRRLLSSTFSDVFRTFSDVLRTFGECFFFTFICCADSV